MSTQQARGDLPLNPRTPALAGLLANKLTVELYRLPGPITPELKLHIAARVARTSGWKGYRGGRQRLAGWAGVYVQWLAPDDTWTFLPVSAAGQTWAGWTKGEKFFVDVLAPGETTELDLTELRAVAYEILEVTDADAVRVLTVSAPLASRVFTGDGPTHGAPLCDTDLDFRKVA